MAAGRLPAKVQATRSGCTAPARHDGNAGNGDQAVVLIDQRNMAAQPRRHPCLLQQPLEAMPVSLLRGGHHCAESEG